MSRRILIVTSSPLCRNPRVLKEAHTLGCAGFQVTVLTLAGRASDESFDQELLKAAPFTKIALPYFGFHGLFGLGAHASRCLTLLARRSIPMGIERRSALGPFHRLYQVASNIPSDLLIAHTELGLSVGLDLQKRGRKVAADFEDWHSQDLLPTAQAHRPLRLLGCIERQLVQQAVYTTTTSGAMAAALQAAYGGVKPSVITNAPLLSPATNSRLLNTPPTFFWFSQTIGPGRGLEAFLRAWRLTRNTSRLCLLGEVEPNYQQHLQALAANGTKPPLEFLPIQPPAQLPVVIARHDLGLALESSIPPSRNLTITNKILQYLDAGLGIIATSTAGHREVLRNNPSAGLFIDTSEPERSAAILDNLLISAISIQKMRASARQLAEQHYCWGNVEPRLLNLVARSLNT